MARQSKSPGAEDLIPAVQADSIVIDPGEVRDFIPEDLVRNLRPGQAIVMTIGPAAQIGEVAEVWLRPLPIIVTARGNVRLDFATLRFWASTPGVEATVDPETKRVTAVNYEKARLIYRARGWLRVDPILQDFGIDPMSLEKMPETRIVEICQRLKTPLFWDLVKAFNAVEWKPDYLEVTEPRAVEAVIQRLNKLKESDIAGRQRVIDRVSKEISEWLNAMKGVGDGDDSRPV